MSTNTKILVTGASGQLGNEVALALCELLPEALVVLTDSHTLDITDATAVDKFIDNGDFTHIINCAAYTAVDKAEVEKSLCTKVNVDAVMNLARAASRNSVHMVHISTDYVFDGKTNRPYNECDKTSPQSHYGSTKRKSETALLGLLPDAVIIRTGWLYSPFGHNFVKTMLRLAKTNSNINVVSDQIGTPTYAADLARIIVRVISSTKWLPGTYHFSNEGVASWYDFAHAILSSASPQTKVTPISTEKFGAPVERPHYSVLDKTKIKIAYNIEIPHWADSLKHCLQRMDID